jgi:hypothetical protein
MAKGVFGSSKCTGDDDISVDGVHDSDNFTHLCPSSNLNYYPHADQPPFFDRRNCPLVGEIIALRDRLAHSIPVELIDVIIDQAEYWPHTSSTLDMTTRIYSGHLAHGS